MNLGGKGVWEGLEERKGGYVIFILKDKLFICKIFRGIDSLIIIYLVLFF